MRTANRFVRPAVRPAGAQAVEFGGPPTAAAWLTWLDSQRRAYMMMTHPRKANESVDQYARRISALVTSFTTSSFRQVRPAGAPVIPLNVMSAPVRGPSAAGALPLNVGSAPVRGYVKSAGSFMDDLGGGADMTFSVDEANPDATANKTSGSSGGLSDAQVATIGNTVASVLGQASNIVIAAMRGADARAAAQIQADAAVRLAELRAQQGATTDPGQSAAINAQISALQAALAQISANQNQGMSDNMKMALVAGGVVLVAVVAYVATRRPRHNPTLYRAGEHGHLEPYRTVPMRKLRKMG